MATVDDLITETINALQALIRDVEGVRKAPPVAQYPTQINTADLPYVLTYPTEGQFGHEGAIGGGDRLDLSYTIILYTQPIGQSTVPQRLDQVLPLAQRIANRLLLRTSVGLIDETPLLPFQVTLREPAAAGHAISPLRVDLQYAGVPYYGATFTVNTRALFEAV